MSRTYDECQNLLNTLNLLHYKDMNLEEPEIWLIIDYATASDLFRIYFGFPDVIELQHSDNTTVINQMWFKDYNHLYAFLEKMIAGLQLFHREP